MPRILGVDIPNDKPTHISLRYIFGIGPTTALRLCEKAKVDPQSRAKELSDDEIARLADDPRPRIHGRRPAAAADQQNIARLARHRLLPGPAASSRPAGVAASGRVPTPAPARARARRWPARRASRKCAGLANADGQPHCGRVARRPSASVLVRSRGERHCFQGILPWPRARNAKHAAM